MGLTTKQRGILMLKKEICQFIAKLLVFVMVMQGIPLWQISKSYTLELDGQKIERLLTLLSYFGPASTEAAEPVASAGSDQSAVKDRPLSSTVMLNGSGSNDPDNDALIYHWYGPFDTTDNETATVTIPEGFYTATLHVHDGTSPDSDTTAITVSPCFSIAARAKDGKVQLTWTHLEDTVRYDIYRAEESDQITFEKIGWTISTYSTYLDTNISNETTYLYVVGALSDCSDIGSGIELADCIGCYSNVISSHPTAIRSRTPVNYNPVIYSSPIIHGTVGIIYNYDVNATDPNLGGLEYILSSPPPGMSIHPTTGLITWMPDTAGIYDVTVDVDDGNGGNDSRSFIVTVAPIASTNTPTVTLIADPDTIQAGQSSTLTWSSTDAESATIDNGIGTVGVSSSTTVSPVATITYTITVTGPGGTTTDNVTITVNRKPVITSSPTVLTVDEGAAYAYDVDAVDPDPDTLEFSLVQAPGGMVIDPATGSISWTPSEFHVGLREVTVEVSDGKGGANTQTFSLTVIAISDNTPPKVSINCPSQVQTSAPLNIEARATDNEGVTRVSVYINGMLVKESDGDTCSLSYNAPPEVGATISIRATALDEAENQGDTIATVTVVEIPDTENPVITSILMPPSAAPGESVTVRAEVTDDRGVAEVRFSSEGTLFGTDTAPPYEATLTIPSEAGKTVTVDVLAEDTSGNPASGQGFLSVAEILDNEPPTSVTIDAPDYALAGQEIVLIATAADNVGLLKMVFFADDVMVAEDIDAPYQAPYTISGSKADGSQVIFKVRASDFSGNNTDSEPDYTRIIAPGNGFIVGEVFDDTTGLSVPGSQVQVISAHGQLLAQPMETTTDGSGQYQFYVPEGQAAIMIEKDGHSSCYRELSVLPDTVSYPLDARITPLGSGQEINRLTGGNLITQDNQIQLYVLPGTFSEDKFVTLTKLSGQGLSGLLPPGWTPLLAVHMGPEDEPLNSPLELTISAPETITGLVCVIFDMENHQWIRLETSISTEGDGVVISVSQMGVIALIRPDTQPAAPPVPEIGQVLTGVDFQSIPEGIVADILPSPEILFMQPGARSNVWVSLNNIQPLPSGTRMVVNFNESYERTNDTWLTPAPMTQDFALYQGQTGFEAHFVASPSEIFDAVLLKEGVIRLASHRSDVADGTGITGPAGGTITSPDGMSLTIPSGALTSSTPVFINAVNEADAAISGDSRFEFLQGVDVDFCGATLSASADLTVTLQKTIAEDAQVLVVQAVEAEGVTQYDLIAIATISGNSLTATAGSLGLPLPGIRESGRYTFLQMTEPVGYVTGTVLSGGQSVISGLVDINTLPFVSLLSSERTNYALASTISTSTVFGKNLTNGNNGTGAAEVTARAQIVTADLTLTESRPAVVSVSPADSATAIAQATSVTVIFSGHMDQNTIDTVSFSLREGVNKVEGAATLLPDGTTVVFQPDNPLEENRLYTVSLSTDIQDTFGQPFFGNQPDETFVSSFTTVDITPPERPEAGQISLGEPVNGISAITGTQGSVEPGVSVTLRNTDTDATITVIASEDGSFSANIEAGLTDTLELILIDEAGNETLIDMGRVSPPEGYAVLGSDGGIVEGEGSSVILMPPGVLPEDTIVSITPADISGMPLPFNEDLKGSIVGAINFSMEDVEIASVVEMKLSVNGYTQYTVVDRFPPHELDREITLPDDIVAGDILTFKLNSVDELSQTAELEMELPIVSDSPDCTIRTITTSTTPVLTLELPAEATAGQTIRIFCKAEPPDIKLRFPAPSDLTGNEQFILYELFEANGQTYCDLVTTAALITLNDGTRVIETNTPPYRGIRKNARNLILALYKDIFFSFAKIAFRAIGLSLSGASPLMALATAPQVNPYLINMAMMWPIISRGKVCASAYEFAVIPVMGGVPATIQVVDFETNNRISQKDIGTIPPGEISSMIILGEDDNNPLVTETTSFKNNAVPLDEGISIGFSHVIDTATVTQDSFYIIDQSGKKIDTDIIFSDNLPGQDQPYIMMVKPLNMFDPDSKYTLIAKSTIARPDGTRLQKDFKFTFITASPAGMVGSLSIPYALSFDVLGDIAVVAARQTGGIINGFHTVDISDPAIPTIVGSVNLDQSRLGMVRAIKGLKDADFITWNGTNITGDIAILSHGSAGVLGFPKLRFYSLNNLSNPEQLAYVSVGASVSALTACGDVQVIDQYGVPQIIIDPCKGWMKGIPAIPAIPTIIDTDGQYFAYFINVGIGLMTIDMRQAIPYNSDRKGDSFGPSYIPADKAGGIIVTADSLISDSNSDLSINSPTNLDNITNPKIIVEGDVLNDSITTVLVNGFEAAITKTTSGRTFSADIPLREGVNRILASGYGTGTIYEPVGIDVLRDFTINPLAGPGTISINIPGLSDGTAGSSISVSASVTNKIKFDRIYINGQLASAKDCPWTEAHPERKDCGWSGTGTVDVPLDTGSNPIVATAIDVDEYDYFTTPSFIDFVVNEGIVLAIELGGTGGTLEVFDSSSLLKMYSVPNLNNCFRVSVARGIITDIDDDGNTGLNENEDDDGITVFDELKNLALVGHGSSNGGVLSFVDITEPHKAQVLGSIEGLGSAYRAWVDNEKGIAYLASGSNVKIIDLTHPAHTGLWDQNSDGIDDRIIGIIDLGMSGTAIDIRVNKEKGLAYVLMKGSGIVILELSQACQQDIGADATRIPVKYKVYNTTLEKEREDLRFAIQKAMGECSGFALNQNAALLAQGSSACIWSENGKCSTAYKPGLSDYDFEFIVPEDMLASAGTCADKIQELIKKSEDLPNKSVFDDVSVFVVSRDVFETANRDVSPGESGCGAGSDPYGDLCLGRNSLILKWVLEGEWVTNKFNEFYNNGIDLEETLAVLRSPMQPDDPDTPKDEDPYDIFNDIDPDYIEPSHIPRLEGKECGCLQDFALNFSGARIRILGAGIGDVPIHNPSFHKKIHKVAKAGIRAIYGKLISSDAGNGLMLETSREEYNSDEGCFTNTFNPSNPGAVTNFSCKPCESFEEYVASKAILGAARKLEDENGNRIISDDEALFAYGAFRHKADVGPQIKDEQEANEFITTTIQFIEDLRTDRNVEKIYTDTIIYYNDETQRKNNYSKCEDDLGYFNPDFGSGDKLELKLPVRLYNDGYMGIFDTTLALFHDGDPVTEKTAELIAGESKYYTKDENNNYIFSIKPLFFDGALHNIQFMADPDNDIVEYNKSNNLDGFYYYFLSQNGTSPPTPEAGYRPVTPPPTVTIPDPPASDICLDNGFAPDSPALEIITTVDGRYEVNTEDGDTIEIRFIVRNTGNTDLENVEIEYCFPQDAVRCHTIDIGDLAAGDTVSSNVQKTVSYEEGSLIVISTARGTYDGPNNIDVSTGITSAYAKINVQEPSPSVSNKIRILSPPKQNDPENPYENTPFRTMADSLIISGICKSNQSDLRVEVRTIGSVAGTYTTTLTGSVSKTLTGSVSNYEFKTNSPVIIGPVVSADQLKTHILDGTEPPNTVIVAELLDNSGNVLDKNEVKVVRVQPDTNLRVISLVDGQERIRASSKQTVTFSVEVINDGTEDLKEVTVLDLLEPKFQPAPFDLAAGAGRSFSYDYAISGSNSGVIVNKAVAFGRSESDSGDIVGPIMDSAEVWVGDLILRPRLIFIPKTSDSIQLSTIFTADGEDVTSTHTGTQYEIGISQTAASISGLILNLVRKIVKDPDLDKVNVPIADIEIDSNGLLTAKSSGFNLIKAKHKSEKTGFYEITSNYALVISGLELAGIELEPHSFFTDAINVPYATVTDLVKSTLTGTQGSWSKTDSNLNLPMILGTTGISPCEPFSPYPDFEWMARLGYAELVSIKFKLMELDILAFDILKGTRDIIDYLPFPCVGIKGVYEFCPINWLIGKVLNFGATQFVDFKIENPPGKSVATVSNVLPVNGIVKSENYGIARLTGTLKIDGYQSRSDDFMVIVPKVISTDVRPDMNVIPKDESTDIYSLTRLGFLQPPDSQLQMPIYSIKIPELVDQYVPYGTFIDYLNKIIPGEISNTSIGPPFDLTLPPGMSDDPLFLRINMQLTLTELQILEIELGLRTPNYLNNYSINEPDIADIVETDILSNLFGFSRKVVGHSVGTTHANVQTCVPFLGSASDNYSLIDETGGAEIIVTDTPLAYDDTAYTNEGEPVAISILDNDTGNIDSLTVVIPETPNGPCTVSLPTYSSVTGGAIFTPSAVPDCYGTYTFHYTVDDTDGNTLNSATDTETNHATVTVHVNARPVADSHTTPPVCQDETWDIDIDGLDLVRDPDKNGINWETLMRDPDKNGINWETLTISSLPGMGSAKVVHADKKIIYTAPTQASGIFGTDTLSYTVEDNNLYKSGVLLHKAAVSLPATITIPVNARPVAKPDPNPTDPELVVNRGDSIIINVFANDEDPDGINQNPYHDLSITSVPVPGSLNGQCSSGIKVINNDNGTVTFSAPQAPNCYGEYSFEYIVIDKDLLCESDPAKVTVRVNEKPVANDRIVNITEVEPSSSPVTITFSVTDLGNDPDAPDLDLRFYSLTAITVPCSCEPVLSCVTQDPGTGDITFELPQASECFGQYIYEFDLQDLDGGISDTAVLTIDVNARPVANDHTVNITEGAPSSAPAMITFSVTDLGNDPDAPDPDLRFYSLTATTAPCSCAPICVTQDPGTGDITFELPQASECFGQYIYEFDLQDLDGGISDTAVLTIDVNARPVANDHTVNITEGAPSSAPLTITFSATDLGNDPDGPGLDLRFYSLTATTAPCTCAPASSCVIQDPGTGDITFELPQAAGCFGQYVYEFDLQDLDGGISDTAVLTIDVKARPVYTCDIAIVSLKNDPNPDISEIMLGGNLRRYYRVINLALNTPLSGRSITATFTDSSTLIGNYTTNAQGFIVLPNAPSEEMGMVIPWDTWGIASGSSQTAPKSYDINLSVDDTCAKSVNFSVLIKGKEYSGSLKAGTSANIEGAIGIDPALGGGYGLDLTFPGSSIDGINFTNNALNIGRSINSDIGLKLKAADIGFELGPIKGSLTEAGFEAGLFGTLMFDDQHNFSLPLNFDGQAALSLLMLQTLYDSFGYNPFFAFISEKLSKRVTNLNNYQFKYGSTGGVKRTAAASAQLPDVTLKMGRVGGQDITANLCFDADMSVSGNTAMMFGECYYPLVNEKVRNLDFRAAFEGSTILNDMALIPNTPLERSVEKVKSNYSVSGNIAGGLGFSAYIDEVTNNITRISISTTHQKAFGYIYPNDQPLNLGDGYQYTLRYSSEDPVKIMHAADRINTLKSMTQTSSDLFNITAGPTLFMNELVEIIKILDQYDQNVEKGDGYNFPIDVSLFLEGTGIGGGISINFDKSINHLIQKGVILSNRDIDGCGEEGDDRETFILEEYPVDDPYVGPLILDELIDTISSAFDAVKTFLGPLYRFGRRVIDIANGAAKTIMSQFFSPSGFELVIDGAAETQLLTVDFSAFKYDSVFGPAQAGLQNPYDVSGPADKPHNGIGGFFMFQPEERTLAVPAELTIFYDDPEVVNLDENSLAIYRWNKNDGEWDFVGGTVDSVNNQVSVETSRLGLYTAAPAMPAGKIEFQSLSISSNPDNTKNVTFTSEDIFLNNGQLIPDDTIFHVLLVVPNAFSGEDGLIVLDSSERVSASGRIQFNFEVPNVMPSVRIIVYSDIGTACFDNTIMLTTP